MYNIQYTKEEEAIAVLNESQALIKRLTQENNIMRAILRAVVKGFYKRTLGIEVLDEINRVLED